MAKALAVDPALIASFASAADVCYALHVSGERITHREERWAAPADAWAALSAGAAAALAPSPPPPAPGAKPSLLPPRPEPRLWLLSDGALGLPAAPGGGSLFTVVSFTPEGVHPREKMLYASARDCVRAALGGERFRVGNYHATEAAELAPAAFAEWRKRDASEAMSLRERAVAEVVRGEAVERAAMPARGAPILQKLAFSLDGALKAAAAGFGAGAARWLEVRVAAAAGGGGGGGGEVLELAASGAESAASALVKRVWDPAAAEPRFFLTAPDVAGEAPAADGEGGGAAPARPLLLLYHCPEFAKPKARMLYSTAKTALQAALAAEGVVVTKTVRPAPAPPPPPTPFFSSARAPLPPSLTHARPLLHLAVGNPRRGRRCHRNQRLLRRAGGEGRERPFHRGGVRVRGKGGGGGGGIENARGGALWRARAARHARHEPRPGLPLARDGAKVRE
jgi:hypothetical protein